jgi:hypothetical protein
MPSNRTSRERRPRGIIRNFRRLLLSSPLLLLGFLSFALFRPAAAQDLPANILGYKVYKANVTVLGPADISGKRPANGASAKLREFSVADVGLYGATFEIAVDVEPFDHSGKVDLLMFRDFEIQGVPIAIEEYRHPFEFKKQTAVTLPSPIRISFSILNMPTAVYKELFESADELPVTGTVLVFGRFKKMGIEFKRVIPVKVDVRIRNPLHT